MLLDQVTSHTHLSQVKVNMDESKRLHHEYNSLIKEGLLDLGNTMSYVTALRPHCARNPIETIL